MKRILYLMFIMAFAVACQKDEAIVPQEEENGAEEVQNSTVKGQIRVKLKREVADRVNVTRTRSGELSTGIEGLDLAALKVGTYRMERCVPYSEKFEEKHRKAGLHLWYDVYFDATVPTRSALEEYDLLSDIQWAEEIDYAELVVANPVPAYMLPLLALNRMAAEAVAAVTPTADEMPFNDPELPNLWHYSNRGPSMLDGALPGADINLFEAWKIETGSPNVIVAVMDGGIQASHPDLADNIWVNEVEFNGLPGVDDDGNGFMDDINGVNFLTIEQKNGVWQNGAITPVNHGTHCAGTISAVNNNRLGGNGIAGGTNKKDGVRLMSCQMIADPPMGMVTSRGALMFVYAADNGAVISSNSWKSGSNKSEEAFMGSFLRDGIDYFIDYAGTDAAGNQNGPMKGGLVVWSAANDNTDKKEAWAAPYERVLTVASMAPNFKRASYSNYGDWVDITAPGGQTSMGQRAGIYSTVVNGYDWYQGTSMACPHVAGCAALVLSKFQGQGYTSEDLRQRLLNSVKDIDVYNPQYAGKLGSGYIDVAMALTPPAMDPPAVTELRLIDVYDDWAILEWEVGVASDGPLAKYELYWGTSSVIGNSIAEKRIYDVKFTKSGTIIRDTLKNLATGTLYYFSLRGFDRWGAASDYAPELSGTTLTNSAPVVTKNWAGEVLMEEGTTRTLPFAFSDPESQQVTIKMEPELSWVKVAIDGNVLNMTIEAGYGIAGYYTLNLIVTDIYGAKAIVPVAFEVQYKAAAPVLKTAFANLTQRVSDGETELKLADYFSDPANGALLYEISNSDNSVAFVQRKGENLYLRPLKAGVATVSVRAKNSAGLSVSTTFTVSVTAAAGNNGNSGQPAQQMTVFQEGNNAFIQLAADMQGTAILRVYNTAGRQVLAREVTIGQVGYNLNLDALSSGVYVLSVESNGSKWTKNIVKR